MTKIKLLNNRSRILKELLHRININNDICLEIDLSKEETLYLKLNINSYEKINIINNLLDKNIISNAIYVDNKKVIKNTYTLNKANINRKVLAYQDQVRKDVQLQLIDILHKLGIKTSHLGYSYIKEAICIFFSSKTIINNMTAIYKRISTKYNTSIASVESNIRRAIEEGFKNASPEDIKEIFGYTLNYQNVCPTNTDFIITITDILKTNFNRYNN